jgi:hypothetical protein
MSQARFSTACGVLALVAACGGVSAAAWGGIVATVSARHEGTVQVEAGAVRVGQQVVPWRDVMVVTSDAPPGPGAGPHVLRLRNGEVLVGKVTGLTRAEATLESALLGTRQVKTEDVAAIDFVPGLGDLGAEKPKSLHRVAGRPISGKLLWLRDGLLAIDAPIGAMELKLDGLNRYVFDTAAQKTAALAGDEVKLVDGGVLRGAVEPVQGGWVVEHPVFGRQTLGAQSWLAVRRFSGPAIYLADLRPVQERTYPLIRRPADRLRIEFSPDGATGTVSRIVIAPKTDVKYQVPGDGARYVLNAGVRLIDGARGVARLEIRVDGQVRTDKVLNPDAEKAVLVTCDVPGGSSLEVTVDFGDRIHFPCAVTIDNALLVRQ